MSEFNIENYRLSSIPAPTPPPAHPVREKEMVYQDRLSAAMEESGWLVERSPRCWVPGEVRDGFSVGKPDLWAQLRRGKPIDGDLGELQRRGIHTMVFEVKRDDDTRQLNGGGFQAMGYMLGWNYKAGNGKDQRLLKRPDVAILVFPEFLIPKNVSNRGNETLDARLHLAERWFWKRGCTILKIQGRWVGFETNVGHAAHTFVRLFKNGWLFGEGA